MNLIDILKEIDLEKTLLREMSYSGKTLINVDIQPEYESQFKSWIYNWVDFLNENVGDNDIVFLYNGNETLGMITESDYQEWLFSIGIDENVMQYATFFDKGYGYFRSCMDSGVDEYDIVTLVKYMSDNNINDTRDITDKVWKDLESKFEDVDSVLKILKYQDNVLFIPELMDFLRRYSNIVLLGGHLWECLREVELALKAMNKRYTILRRFTY